jgi:adenylate cyclase
MGISCSLKSHFSQKAYLILGFFYFFYSAAYSQNQTPIDSLELVYTMNNFEEPIRLKILQTLAADHEDPQKKLAFSIELIQTAQALDSMYYLYDGFLQKGTALRLKSDLTQALESYFQAAKIAIDTKSYRDLGIVNIAIADVYSIMGNHKNAVKYYHDAIDILREENDSILFASALENLGDEYLTVDKPDSALLIFEESGAIFRALNYEPGIGYNLGNIGIAYAEQGKDDLAKANMNEAIKILEKLEDYYPISVYLTYMSDIYFKQDDWNTALSYAHNSLDLAKRYALKEQISDSYLQISKLHEQAGNLAESHRYYKNHIAYKDSVSNIASVQQMADIRTEFEISQKQIEVDLLNEQKRNQQLIVIASVIAFVLLFLLAMGLYRRFYYIRKTNTIIADEKHRSDKLLLNILPEETAHELKQSGKVRAKKFDSVTVLFTDFKGFTHYAENLSPEKLVESVDFYFSKFDEIMEKHGLEKIKTVGDAYMCAGGLHSSTKDHAAKMVQAALEISEFVSEAKKNNKTAQTRFDIRIGINTGPVVAGVVGTKKFAYDIWGDTVNIASRMESNSEPGKINISENTYTLIKGEFDCMYRGEIEVKNIGIMKMYFVNNMKDNDA